MEGLILPAVIVDIGIGFPPIAVILWGVRGLLHHGLQDFKRTLEGERPTYDTACGGYCTSEGRKQIRTVKPTISENPLRSIPQPDSVHSDAISTYANHASEDARPFIMPKLEYDCIKCKSIGECNGN